MKVTIFHQNYLMSSSEIFYIPVLHGSVAQVEGCRIRQAHDVFEATVSPRHFLIFAFSSL